MPSGKRTPTIESKTLSIAIKRAMAVRDIRTPALAKESGVPYGTLRRILELNSVADYEQLRRIAEALRMPLSEIVEDAENLAEDPDVIADYHEETSSDVPSTDATSADVDTTPADEANAALASADNGVDIDAWADRIRVEDAVSEEKE
ncbi:helix-turn-helix domain-containing protein [Bifidobacterium sp.]|uniref:helix-turn-helix domain-containing protein n=1 Tax=Bifidobacterium TaxID=1678 RepID=UPI003865DE45